MKIRKDALRQIEEARDELEVSDVKASDESERHEEFDPGSERRESKRK